MLRKIRANRTSTSSPSPTFDSERFLSEKNQEAFEKLNLKRNIWAERKVLLDELDPEIRRNLSVGAGYLYWIFLILLWLP